MVVPNVICNPGAGGGGGGGPQGWQGPGGGGIGGGLDIIDEVIVTSGLFTTNSGVYVDVTGVVSNFNLASQRTVLITMQFTFVYQEAYAVAQWALGIDGVDYPMGQSAVYRDEWPHITIELVSFSKTIVLDANPHTIKLRAKQITGGGPFLIGIASSVDCPTILTVQDADGSGTQGFQGPQGPQGWQGVAGAGADEFLWLDPADLAVQAITPGVGFNNVNYSANKLRLWPLQLRRACKLSALGANFMGGIANFRLGLYAAKSVTNLYPGALIYDSGSIACVGGYMSSSPGVPIALAAGLYWLAYFADGVNQVYTPLYSVGMFTDTSGVFRSLLSKAYAFAALSDPAPAGITLDAPGTDPCGISAALIVP
jgi:hypothetical protein